MHGDNDRNNTSFNIEIYIHKLGKSKQLISFSNKQSSVSCGKTLATYPRSQPPSIPPVQINQDVRGFLHQSRCSSLLLADHVNRLHTNRRWEATWWGHPLQTANGPGLRSLSGQVENTLVRRILMGLTIGRRSRCEVNRFICRGRREREAH